LSEEWIACEHGSANSRHETPGFVSDVPDWPDIKQLARVVIEYAKRDLTYDDDVLAAFAGSTTVLSRSAFRPGFYFGLPEMFFDVCLLWEGDRRQAQPLRRRKLKDGKAHPLPSWSWVSVKGQLFLDMWTSFGSHFYASTASGAAALPLPDPRLLQPLVRWRKNILTPTDSEDSVGSKPLSPPRHDEYVFSTNNGDTESTGSLSKWSLTQKNGEGSTDYEFSHPSFTDRTFWHPFPLLACKTPTTTSGSSATIYSPTLTFTSKRAWLVKAERLDRHPWLDCPIYRTHVLRTREGVWAGVLSDDGLAFDDDDDNDDTK